MASLLPSGALAPLFVAVLAAAGSAQMAPLQSPTKVAVASPAPAQIPGGSFETPSGAAGPPVAPYHSYLSFTTENGWTYGHAAGVAHRLSGFVNLADLTAIAGDRVAFVQGETSSLSTTLTLPGVAANYGPWRLVYSMANRVDAGTTVNLPFVEVWINGERVASEAPRHTDFRSYTTRAALAAPAGGSLELAIEFRRVVDPETGQPTVGTVFFDDVRLELVRPWRAASSWSPSGIPTASDRVEIPDDAAIAMIGTCVAEWVHVQGELIAVQYENQAPTLDTTWVAVVGDGACFEVGRPGAPFQQEFVLTLLGGPGASGFAAGTKFLMSMMGGRIDLHGVPKTPWTRLVATASASDTSFDVADASGWEPGDVLVVTGSTFDRDVTQWTDYAEKVVIDAITPITGGYRIDFVASPTLDGAVGVLAHLHLGGANAVTDLTVPGAPSGVPTELDQAAEVANLTRNILVRGGEPEDDSQVDFGGHVMVMRCPSCCGVGEGRFSYVELVRMGQETVVGRYPIHFHMLKCAGEGQYVVGCSIHETYNRAITVHGTDSVRVEDNVVYRAQGHAMFLEDGSEMFNEFRRNLVISTLKPGEGEETIPSDNSLDDFRDRTPSAYWITNPYNVFVDNVAAGTIGSGFWLIFPREVTGLSASETDLLARERPFRMPFMLDAGGQSLFRGNRAHGCRLAFDVNDSIPDLQFEAYQPFFDTGVRQNLAWEPSRPTNPAHDVTDPNVARTPTRETVLDFVAYGCDGALYASTAGDQVIFERAVIADCTRAVDFASYHEVRDSVIVEEALLETVNAPNGQVNAGKSGVMLYDGAARYVGVVFLGFDGPPSGGPLSNTAVLISARGAAVNHPNHVFEDCRFPDVLSSNLPVIVWPDAASFAVQATVLGYPNVTQAAGNLTDPQNPLAPSKWGGIVYDASGELTGSPGLSIVRDLPYMRTGHADEAVWSNSLTTAASHALVTPHRFGHLRLMYGAAPVTTTTASDVVIYRTKHAVSTAGGTFPPGSNGVGFEHRYNARQYKQIPVLVNPAPDWSGQTPVPSRYIHTIHHKESTFLQDFSSFEVQIDDALPGDEVIFLLQDLNSWLANNLTAVEVPSNATLPEYSSITPFLSSSGPSLFFGPSGAIYLRIPIRTAANGSQPAGVRKFGEFKGAHSINLPDSPWRSETVRVSWN